MAQKIYTRAEIDTILHNLKQSKHPLVLRGAELIAGLDQEKESLKEQIVMLKSLLSEKEYIINSQQDTLTSLMAELAAGTKAVLDRIVERVRALAKSKSAHDEPLCELAVLEALNIINSYLLPHDADPNTNLFKESTDVQQSGTEPEKQPT